NINSDAAEQLDMARARIAETDMKIRSIQEQALVSHTNITGVVHLLEKLEQQRNNFETELEQLQRQSLVSDESRILKLCERFERLAKGNLDNDSRGELQAALQQLVKRIELRLRRNGSEIVGRCCIFPFAGDEILFDLHFHP